MPRGAGSLGMKSQHAIFREEETMRNLAIGLVVVVLIAIGGCAGMTETQQRTLTGGAAGAELSPAMRVLGRLSGLVQVYWAGFSTASMRSPSKKPISKG
jgi:hypothetical protein